MQSPFHFIAKPHEGKRYSNTKNVEGLDLIVSTSEEDHRFSNRYAEVVEVPRGYSGPIKVGDILLVHHNVFKFYNDMKGRRQSGRSFLKDDLFLIEEDQYFAYKRDGVWSAYGRYCFVSPVPTIDSFIKKPGSEEPLVGIMEMPNERLLSLDVNAGDMVCFKPDSEYEFIVDDKKMYRMFDHQITIKL
jgi:hypothetical protein